MTALGFTYTGRKAREITLFETSLGLVAARAASAFATRDIFSTADVPSKALEAVN